MHQVWGREGLGRGNTCGTGRTRVVHAQSRAASTSTAHCILFSKKFCLALQTCGRIRLRRSALRSLSEFPCSMFFTRVTIGSQSKFFTIFPQSSHGACFGSGPKWRCRRRFECMQFGKQREFRRLCRTRRPWLAASFHERIECLSRFPRRVG